MGGEVLYFISDTHLGDGSAADHFRYEPQLLNLLGKIESEPRAQLILLGDFLELWACALEAIMVRHAPIFHSLARIASRHRVTYVVGNHDCLPWYYYLGQQSGRVTVLERFAARRQTLVAIHGHQYDPFNQVRVNPDGTVGVPWTERLVEAIGAVERAGGEPASKAIADVSQALAAAAGAVSDIFRKESPGERGYPLEEQIYDDAARGLMRAGARHVLMGHTHHPLRREYGSRLYINTGSWVWDRYPPTYGRLAGGELELLDANTHQPYRKD